MKVFVAAPLILAALLADTGAALQQPTCNNKNNNRRALLQKAVAATSAAVLVPSSLSLPALAVDRAPVPDLNFVTTPSGLQYADAKLGSGPALTTKGTPIAIDYTMSTTGARYGTKIYSTKDSGSPYRWKLGDGSTIAGLEEAIAGSDAVTPMRPGGIRRVIIPAALAYQSLAQPLPGMQIENCQEGGSGVGPIPPKGEGAVAEYYQRFKNIYCNANRPYQPDLVMDVKLYGPRS